jgi:hypothetical protein
MTNHDGKGNWGCGMLTGLFIGFVLALNIDDPSPFRPMVTIGLVAIASAWAAWRFGDRFWRWLIVAFRYVFWV